MSKYINADEFTATIRKSTSPSGAEWIVAKVNEMPSADVVEVKHGEWNLQEINEDHEYEWVCSECEGRNDVKTNFCPNCGADMRERKETK